jgi:hypothetical protein
MKQVAGPLHAVDGAYALLPHTLQYAAAAAVAVAVAAVAVAVAVVEAMNRDIIRL